MKKFVAVLSAAALGIDYSAFNDLAGQVVEVTTAE